jgi:hypothetical protein
MSEYLIYIGVALACSAGVITNFRLYELNRYLKENDRELWVRFGFGNDRVHLLTKLYRLRALAANYDSDDLALSRKLQVFTLLQTLTATGLGILFVGVLMEILQYT